MRSIVVMCSLILNGLAPAEDSPDLSHYQWKHRLLVFNSIPGPDGPTQTEYFKRKTLETKERDLLLIAVDPAQRTLWNKLNFQQNQFKLILIGKDGTIKREYSQATPMKSIFRLIDSMPMRQEEMAK